MTRLTQHDREPQTPDDGDARRAEDLALELGRREDEIARLRRELALARAEIEQDRLWRKHVGTMIGRVWRSPSWQLSAPLRWLTRAAGRLRLTERQLVPLDPVDHGPGGAMTGNGRGQFLLPTLPLSGWVRVRARLTTSAGSRAHLYFDTGHGFHAGEYVELGRVAADTTIDRLVALPAPTHCFRLDLSQRPCDYTLHAFSVEPLSALLVDARAVARNVTAALGIAPPQPAAANPNDGPRGAAARRPSPLIGLRLLLTGQFRAFHRQLRVNLQRELAHDGDDYAHWLKAHAITDAHRQRMRAQLAAWTNPPKISVILPVYNVAEEYLRKCIESVTNQLYPHWELCIADDASPSPHVRRVLDEYAARDPHRIKVLYRETNGNISAASNSALSLATGDYVALLDHDDELTEHALFKVAEALVADPSLDMIYSDEDKLTPDGKRVDPFFKPDWSPEYFLACMYTCHLGVYRTEMIRRIGGWRSAFDSAQDYDLVLRAVAANPKIHHIPDVLYHWRTIPTSTASGGAAKPQAHETARRALQSYLDLTGHPGRVEPGPSEGFHRVRYAIQGNPKVSVVIPSACRKVDFRGRSTYLVYECVSSIRRLSTYKNIEVIVLDNEDMPDDLADLLKPFDVRRIPFPGPYSKPFNLAKKMNTGAFAAQGEHLLILNDDVEVISPDWIESMLEYSQLPGVGAVGAQLLFPNDTLQHTGVNVLGGNPGHPFYQFPADHPGYFFSSQVHRNWSAVTGACMMTRADVFKSVGGFSESFPLNYNDVDYCLKVRETGKRIVYMPYAKLYHHESVSKTGTYSSELDAFKRTWLPRLPRDPYYNPNLTPYTCDFRIDA